jgi:hypothetical protein
VSYILLSLLTRTLLSRYGGEKEEEIEVNSAVAEALSLEFKKEVKPADLLVISSRPSRPLPFSLLSPPISVLPVLNCQQENFESTKNTISPNDTTAPEEFRPFSGYRENPPVQSEASTSHKSPPLPSDPYEEPIPPNPPYPPSSPSPAYTTARLYPVAVP